MLTNPKALILVNTGTPKSPKVKDVRKYLFQFLNDKRIIDLPWIPRKILVNFIIVPFRAPKSAKLYEQLWTKNGSPLLINLNMLVQKTQKKLEGEYDVYGAMRYGAPSFKKLFNSLENKKYSEITILPLYPQYATSTTESVADIINKSLNNWKSKQYIHFVRQFYNHPGFVKAFVSRIKEYSPEKYDHVLFSYHGLPLRQIDKMHPGIKNTSCPCTEQLPKHGQYCYKATCYETSRQLANAIGMQNSQYSTTFQSRLSKNWLRPFTDEKLIQLATEGKKHILIAAPSFVADCLETTIELGAEYQNIFRKHGGKNLTLVESLNDMNDWVDGVIQIIRT